jgi:predicted membrane protein
MGDSPYFYCKFLKTIKMMETTETSKRMPFQRYYKLNKSVTATTLVLAGLLILGHNLGIVSDYFYRIFISWPMLLIVLGITSLLKRTFWPSCIFLGTGVYFLLSRIIGVDGFPWMANYWPLFLILLGLIILFHRHRMPYSRCHHHARLNGRARRTEQIIDGFVTVDISFGNSRHIVLDPVFRGADLDSSFGAIALDLRRTSLEAPETYIDVNCSFGGVEIFVPSHWCLLSEIDNAFGSCEDKRYVSQEIDTAHKLIIRGDISFGSLIIKN